MSLNKGNFLFRRLGTADQTFYREMFYQSLHVPPGHPPFPRSILDSPGLKKYLLTWGRAGDIGIVLEKDQEAIGAVWCRLLKGYGYVDDQTPELGIALLEAWRGQGLGQQLIERLVEEVHTAGFAKLSLSVSKTNPAFRLYQRLGFTKVAEDQEAYVMLKYLNL